MTNFFLLNVVDDHRVRYAMTEKMTLDEARIAFEGKPYSREVAIQIERCGFGYAISAANGRIDMIYTPVSFRSKSVIKE